MAAHTQPADGWIEWNGGQCPVADFTPVELRFREDLTRPSGGSSSHAPQMLNWGRRARRWAGDIIAYRALADA